MPLKRLASIDFGKKRIGVALSDEMKMIASPLTTLEGFTSLKEAAEKLATALKSYAIEKIVIGLPLHMSGEESELSALARQFGKAVEARLELPVIYWDERLSSKQVERSMRDAGLKRKKQAKLSDTMAACAILQNFLDAQI